MANQYTHPKNKGINEANPKSLYELLIYDNHKLASKTEGPHLILRRSVKGSEEANALLSSVKVESDEAESGQLQLESATPDDSLDDKIADEQPAEIQQATEQPVEESATQNKRLSAEHEEEAISDNKGNEFVEATTISNYLASLSNHVQSDVLRVVDAIIELEKAVPTEESEKDAESEGQTTASGSSEVDEPAVKRWADDELEEDVQGMESSATIPLTSSQESETENNLGHDSGKKKGIDISDIFRSLKKARKKAQQKNYSYTKKVEYEDH